jgi:hypothetical protein
VSKIVPTPPLEGREVVVPVGKKRAGGCCPSEAMPAQPASTSRHARKRLLVKIRSFIGVSSSCESGSRPEMDSSLKLRFSLAQSHKTPTS